MTRTVDTPMEVQALQDWVTQCLFRGSAGGSLKLFEIDGDAGFRKYYRIGDSQPPMLAVNAPPVTENNEAFCHVARLLRQYGIHAPQVYAVDYEQGFLLIEDLEGELLWHSLQSARDSGQPCSAIEALYEPALQCLLTMTAIPNQDCGLETYDENKLQTEMDLFPEWFVQQLLAVDYFDADRDVFDAMNRALIDSALSQPRVFVHRDFHCRNLLLRKNNSLGVIDFQDAVLGPLTYDLVSLYRDCYLYWPEKQVEDWVGSYYSVLSEKNLLSDIDQEIFMRWFDWMGMQRHIKVLGIFARLYLRDKKAKYLDDLPLVIHYVLSVARKYREFDDFVSLFEEKLMPVVRNQSWYREIR